MKYIPVKIPSIAWLLSLLRQRLYLHLFMDCGDSPYHYPENAIKQKGCPEHEVHSDLKCSLHPKTSP